MIVDAGQTVSKPDQRDRLRQQFQSDHVKVGWFAVEFVKNFRKVPLKIRPVTPCPASHLSHLLIASQH